MKNSTVPNQTAPKEQSDPALHCFAFNLDLHEESR